MKASRLMVYPCMCVMVGSRSCRRRRKRRRRGSRRREECVVGA